MAWIDILIKYAFLVGCMKHKKAKPWTTGRNLTGVYNSRSGCKCDMYLSCFKAKWPNSKLKTGAKQRLVFSG